MFSYYNAIPEYYIMRKQYYLKVSNLLNKDTLMSIK